MLLPYRNNSWYRIPPPVLAGLLVISLAAPQARSELSKGHRLLVQHGIQVQGMITKDDVFHLATYQDAHYTSINWLWASNPSLHGPAPGFPWARWAHSQSDMPPKGGEALYMSKLIALQLGDEWNLNDDAVRTNAVSWFNAVRDQYPNTILYNNNFGGQVNDAALGDFISRARPDMICFDDYPFRSDYTSRQPITPPGGSHAAWFSHLRRYRQHAMDNGIPLAAYTQTFHAVQDYDQTVYRDPSTSEMNLNTFGALAFDVKYLTDFTYNTGASSLFTTPGGDSNPTPLYEHRKEINRQVRNLSPALVRLTCINKLNASRNSVDTMIIRGKHATGPGTDDWNALPVGFQVDPQAAGYSDWEFGRNDPYLSGWSVTNLGTKNNSLRGDVIISWFKVLDESMDGAAAGQVYFMVVNALTDAAGSAAECRQRITLDFTFGASGITSLQRLSRDTGRVETLALPTITSTKRRLTLELDGGMADLFKFNTGAPFVGRVPGDFDLDDDVDQEDFGQLQRCLSDQPVTASPECGHADLTSDGYANEEDLTLFRSCMNGGQKPPGC